MSKFSIPFEHIATVLESSYRRNVDGSISWSGDWFEDCCLILTAHDKFSEDIDISDRRRIVWEAINDCANKGPIHRETLITTLNKCIGRFIRSMERPYIYMTKLSIEWPLKSIVVRYGGAAIKISGQVPKKFDRSILDRYIRNGDVVADPEEYAWVRVRVTGRSYSDAQAKASDILDFVRGSVNFGLNANIWTEHTSQDSRPLNRILLGPNQTLHNVDGSLAIKQFWYEPYYKKYDVVRVNTDKWKEAYDYFEQMRGLIHKSQYGGSIQRLVIRYCRALDSGDPSSVLLQLWGILESITKADRGNHDVLTKRASNLFDDAELAHTTLQVMRNRRNQYVHSGVRNEASREDVVLLHRTVVRAIILAFEKSRSFSSLDDVATFLALPNNKRDLQKGIKFRQAALKYHGF